MTNLDAALAGLATCAGLMTAVWIVSLARQDASIVDRWWGMAFVLLAWCYLGTAGGWRPAPASARLLVVLVTIWGVRLSLHITRRNWGHGEDYRYRAMRARRAASFWWSSLFVVFLLQGLLAWVIAMPLLAGARAGAAVTSGWIVGGMVCWAIGFCFEAIGDAQLARFKADAGNRGRVMDRGLWRYTRHPNYFGDALLWWGYFGFAAAGGAWWTIVGPALMTLLLLKVSGVALLERTLAETKPAYRDYVHRTSAFVPLPPRGGSGGGDRNR
jgi:steroid 5-alpha reductase family enzyme